MAIERRIGKERSLTIRLPEYLVNSLQEAAEETDTSKAYHVRRALEIYFGEAYAEAEEAKLYKESGKAEYIDEDELKKELGIKPSKKSAAKVHKHEEVVGIVLKDVRRRILTSLDQIETDKIFEGSRKESKKDSQEETTT